MHIVYSSHRPYDASVATEKFRPATADAARGVYGISIAADLAGSGIQNLRLYERKGLIRPTRSTGGTRLYSANDVLRLQRITELLAAGLNLAGIAMVLDLQDDNNRIRAQQHTVRQARNRSSLARQTEAQEPGSSPPRSLTHRGRGS
jgi:MerR family transcriptional regulator, heat shock protein HspR